MPVGGIFARYAGRLSKGNKTSRSIKLGPELGRIIGDTRTVLNIFRSLSRDWNPAHVFATSAYQTQYSEHKNEASLWLGNVGDWRIGRLDDMWCKVSWKRAKFAYLDSFALCFFCRRSLFWRIHQSWLLKILFQALRNHMNKTVPWYRSSQSLKFYIENHFYN
jgi:hypothetical protein